MKRLVLISASFAIASATFAQSSTKCVTAPVNLTGQATITTSGNKVTTSQQEYVYYTRKHGHRKLNDGQVAGIPETWHSKPLMLNNSQDVNAIPETYNVTLTTQDNKVSVCPDSTLNVAANINVEKSSSFTGNYPGTDGDKKMYKRVTKRQYKIAARNMRRIKRKEEKIARRTRMTVEVSEGKA